MKRNKRFEEQLATNKCVRQLGAASILSVVDVLGCKELMLRSAFLIGFKDEKS